MKQVLSVQDLSCVGKCSLTVALPVLSAMGCQCAALPTAVLSTHTAFPAPHRHMLTEDIPQICQHWQSVGVAFDAVTVGYLADAAQTEAVASLLDAFDAPVILDPVMGDHGRLYSGITGAHAAAVKDLCRKGNILLPNITEAAVLTGLDYRPTGDMDYFLSLCKGLLTLGPEAVVLTGVSLREDQTGFMVAFPDREPYVYQAPRIPRQHHGTGDLFCAVFTGAMIAGRNIADAAVLAARFVERVIDATPETTPFGINFESQLPWLWEQLQ